MNQPQQPRPRHPRLPRQPRPANSLYLELDVKDAELIRQAAALKGMRVEVWALQALRNAAHGTHHKFAQKQKSQEN